MKPQRSDILFVGFAVALLLLGSVAWFGWHHTVRTQETAALVAHSERERDAWAQMLLLIERVQSEQRGYLLTGEPAFLELFESGLNAVAEQQRRLEQLVHDAEQVANLAALERLLAERMAFARRNVALRQNAGFEAASQELLTLKGKNLTDQIAATIVRMDARSQTLLDQRSVAAKQEARTTRLLSLTGIGLSFVLLITVFALLLRENRLRQRSESEIDRFFRLSLDMLCIASADGYFKRISPAFTQTLGWSAEEMLARPFLDFVHPDDHAATLREVERQVLAGGEVLQFNNRYRHKDGSWRVLSWKSLPQPSGLMYAIARDITEQSQRDDQLAGNLKALTDFKAALDEHAIVAITDARGKIVYVNDKFCAISKYAREELIGKDHRIINSGHHPKAFIRELWQTITDGRVWKGELKNRAKDGTIYWVATTIVPFLDDTGEPSQYIAIRTDITERKRAEEEIVQLNAELRAHATQLETVNKELESFAYSVSHDLRAPLRGMAGFSQALLEDYEGQLDATGQDSLRRIRAGAQRMGQLIDDLLNLSQVTRSEMTLDAVNLTALARKVITELQPEQAGRAVRWDVSESLTGYGDARLLQLVLENLLGNALKFTGKCEHARVEFGQQTQGAELVFYVRDNGAGFDMAYASRLFGAFQRLHTPLEFPGTGIGLATVQRIVHRHGGRVWAEAQPGVGATFYFTLPIPT